MACKHTQKEAEAILKQDKILGAALRAADKLTNLNIKNGYVTDATVDEVSKLADDAGFMYEQGKGFFYTNDKGDKTKAAVNQVHKKIKEDYNDFTNTNLFDKEVLARYDAAEEKVAGEPKVYNNGTISNDISSITSLEALKEAQLGIIPPSISDSQNYEYSGKEYYRTTASLGFTVSKADRKQVLKNASAVGNFMDELGKRIFRGDEPQDMTYEDINEFVKEEAKLRNIQEGEVEQAVWEILYKNPVSREAYEEMTNALFTIKRDIAKQYNIKEFHTDIMVWDNDKRIAGEVDVLAEHNDGSFTVIDLKSRKEGLNRYSFPETKKFNDKSKHTMQTNTYSNALAKMGFKLNAPLIIMSKPNHPKDKNEIIEDTTFDLIEEDNILTLIELERREDNVVKLNVGPSGKIPLALQQYYDSTTSNYELWLRQREAAYKKAKPKELQVNDKQKERLQKRLQAIRESLISFKNISKSTLTGVTITDELDVLIEKLNVASKFSLDENLLEHQINIAGNFFAYAANQLNELHKVIQYPAKTQEARKKDYIKIMNYRGVFKTAQELFEQLEVIKDDLGVKESDVYDNVKMEFHQFAGINANLTSDLNIYRKTLFLEMVTEAYLGSKGEIKMNNIYRKEAEDLYTANALKKEDGTSFKNEKSAVENYINEKRRRPEYVADVKEAMKEELDELINNPSKDISKVSFFLNSDTMVNNDYVQIFHKMLMNAEQRFSSTANEEVIKFAQLNDKLKLSRRQIEQLITTDAEGNKFLVSDYDIEFYSIKEGYRKKIFIIDKQLENTTDVKERQELSKKSEELSIEFTKWFNANTVNPEKTDNNGNIIPNTKDLEITMPINKWKTDYSKFTAEQLEALEAFKSISDKNDDERIGTRFLKKRTTIQGADYYKLPGVLRTQFGYAVRGQFIKGVKKAYEEATEIELGDVEEGQGQTAAPTKEEELKPQSIKRAYTGLDGKPAFYTPIFFRASPKERQNTDLFTIYAMEIQNGIRYEIDSKLATNATIFLDTTKGATFFAQVGIEGSFNQSVYAPEDSDVVDTRTGETAIVTRMIEKMMKSRVYSITQEYGGMVAGKDINRIIGAISSYTTFSAMSFRGLSALSNLITGNVAASLEAAGGEFMTKRSMTAAKAEYYSNIAGLVGDFGSPVKRNRINQMMAILDVQGDRDILTNEFERTNKITQLLKSGTSLATYSMGEHEIHATVMLAILNETKIINSKGKWITKEGKITDNRKEAANMSDAFVINEIGIVEIAKWAEYSEFDTVNKIKDGGLASIRDLIKDRVTRTQGAFDSRLQANLNRHWYGKLFFQFKKHMPPQILNRFRGISHATTKTSNLRDSDKYFNLHAKTEEYGYFTSFVRFIHTVIKQEKMNVFSYMKAGKNEWRQLSKHERANLVKSMTELSYILATIILAGMAAAAAGDDDKGLWALAYILRRQTNEGGLQYLNPMENWRVMNSPMAAVGKLQNLSDALVQMYPGIINDDYETGALKGKNKLVTKMARAAFLGPILDQGSDEYNRKIYNSLSQ